MAAIVERAPWQPTHAAGAAAMCALSTRSRSVQGLGHGGSPPAQTARPEWASRALRRTTSQHTGAVRSVKSKPQKPPPGGKPRAYAHLVPCTARYRIAQLSPAALAQLKMSLAWLNKLELLSPNTCDGPPGSTRSRRDPASAHKVCQASTRVARRFGTHLEPARVSKSVSAKPRLTTKVYTAGAPRLRTRTSCCCCARWRVRRRCAVRLVALRRHLGLGCRCLHRQRRRGELLGAGKACCRRTASAARGAKHRNALAAARQPELRATWTARLAPRVADAHGAAASCDWRHRASSAAACKRKPCASQRSGCVRATRGTPLPHATRRVRAASRRGCAAASASRRFHGVSAPAATRQATQRVWRARKVITTELAAK